MSQPTLYVATDEFVAGALLSDLLPVPAATTLPKLEVWPVYLGTIRGFATVGIVGGGELENALEDPVVSVGTWAAVPGSDNPQWGAAAQLASIVWRIAKERFVPRTYRQSVKYEPACVLSVSPVARPRRINDPDTSIAHFETEIRLHWVPEVVA
jgi:hypothetical protein